MKDRIARLRAAIAQLSSVDGLVLRASEVRAGIPAVELDELEEGLEVRLCPELRAFYAETGGVSVAWTIDPSRAADAFSEEELGYLAGAIGILDPFTMVMGKSGRRWKDDIWFDFLPADEQAKFAAFAPFDFPTGEYAFGFLVEGGRVGPTMRLFESSSGIVATDFTFERYLEHLIATHGLFHAHAPEDLPTQDLVPRALALLAR